jgi:hypothetical protein
MDVVNGMAGRGAGPRASFLLAVAFLALGAILLRPVLEPRRATADLAIEEPVPAA